MTTRSETSLRVVLARVAAATVFSVAAVVWPAAHASIGTTDCANEGVSCTLQELFDGGSFTIDEQTYEDFWFFDAYTLDTYETLYLSFENVVVTPFTRRDGLHGFNIAALGDFGAPTAADWFLGFDYQLRSTTPLIASGIEFGENVSALSEAWGRGYLDDGSWTDQVSGTPGFLWDDYAEPGPLVLPNQPLSMYVQTDIYLAAGDPLDFNFMHLSTVTPIPEPLSMYMALAGLAVVTGAARRRLGASRRSTSR